jgi:phage gp45-like
VGRAPALATTTRSSWEHRTTRRVGSTAPSTDGGIFWSASKKIAIVENYNIKMDPQQTTIDTWIKSALVTDVKHTATPEVIEVGLKKTLTLAGVGTCAMKDGSAADFYRRDVYSVGDFSHKLAIFVVSKDAPEDEKKVALSALRHLEYTDKLKPHYKK